MYGFDNDGKTNSDAIPTPEDIGTFSKQNWQTPVDDKVNMSEFYKNMFNNGGEYNPASPFSDKALDDILKDVFSEPGNPADSDPARYMQESIKYHLNTADLENKPNEPEAIDPNELNDECLE